MGCALAWLITGIISAGVLGAALRGWGIAWKHLRLEEQQRTLSTRVNSIEQSQRARVKWAKKDQDEEELRALAAQHREERLPW